MLHVITSYWHIITLITLAHRPLIVPPPPHNTPSSHHPVSLPHLLTTHHLLITYHLLITPSSHHPLFSSTPLLITSSSHHPLFSSQSGAGLAPPTLPGPPLCSSAKRPSTIYKDDKTTTTNNSSNSSIWSATRAIRNCSKSNECSWSISNTCIPPNKSDLISLHAGGQG